MTLAVLLGVAACTSDSTRPRAFGSIKFDSASITLVTDDTLLVPATVVDERGAQMFVPISYRSADTTIAAVADGGRIVGKGVGATTITATAESHAIDLAVAVVRPTVRSVGLAADTGTLVVDQSTALVATVTDARGRQVRFPLTYSSSDPSVASVDGDGRVTAAAMGGATITVRADTARATFRVVVGAQFSAMTTGDLETCGISTRGPTYCWGAKALGVPMQLCTQLGLPCSPTPVKILNAPDFTAIAAGDMHVCALDATGAAFCWGNNWHGQLGQGTSGDIDSVTPRRVLGGLRFKAITAGRFHTCAIATTGESYCWGDDELGQLGAGVVGAETCMGVPCATQPVRVAGAQSFVALAANDRATCGRTPAGALYCWGNEIGGTEACVGNPNTDCTRTPLPELGGTAYSDFVMGDVHKCGQLTAGTLECWGANYFGMFGDGTTNSSFDAPVPGAAGMSFAQIVSRRTGVCGLTADGSAYCWGQNVLNEQGTGNDNANVLSPARVGGTMTFTRIWSGSSGESTCGMTPAGRAYCWGDGRFGQLGDGKMTTNTDPQRVAPLP